MKKLVVIICFLLGNVVYGQLYWGTLNDSTVIITRVNDTYEVKMRGWDKNINAYADIRVYNSKTIPVGFHAWNEKDENGNYYKTKNDYVTKVYANDYESYVDRYKSSGYKITSETSSTGGYQLVTFNKGEEYITVTFINGKFESMTNTKFNP
jgi:hypothetical protein